MQHSTELIATVAVSFGLAILFGLLATRLKMPTIVGYLLAGVVIGPATPGFGADVALARQLAEIGVMLLMFGVGLHFSLDDLLAVRKIALPGAIVQVAVAAALGFALAQFWGWSAGSALVFGLGLSVASTVVVLRALEGSGALTAINGRIAIGWLVVEDLIMIVVLVLLPPMAGLLAGKEATGTAADVGMALIVVLGKAVVFIAFMIVAGRRLLPQLLTMVARTGSRELFTLCVVAAAITVAYVASALFDLSFALGAFLAGMMMRESELSHRAAEESLPLRDAFAVLFFVSVGMLFDPAVLSAPGKLLAVLAIVMLATPLTAFALVLAFRYSLITALTVGASLSQIGEFSFVLAALGVSLGLMTAEGQGLIVAAAMLSIAANPLVFAALRPVHAWIVARPHLARHLERGDAPLATLPMTTAESFLSGQVVLVGYGRVGKRIAQSLGERGVPYVVAEQNRERVKELREAGIPSVSGDAAQAFVLIQAHVAKAGMLVVATPDTVSVRSMVQIARSLNPSIEIVVRTHDEEEAQLLRKENLGVVFYGEQELALAMTRHVLARKGIETSAPPAKRSEDNPQLT